MSAGPHRDPSRKTPLNVRALPRWRQGVRKWRRDAGHLPPEPVPPWQAARRAARSVVRRAGALLLLAAASPLLLLAVVLIKWTSKGPALCPRPLPGKGGRPFDTYRLRTTCDGAGGPRVTPVGRLLRATRLDALPLLWSVARGDLPPGSDADGPSGTDAGDDRLTHGDEAGRLPPGVGSPHF
jgi:hypothetical protein